MCCIKGRYRVVAEMHMAAFCHDCKAVIDEAKEAAEGRQPCPACGSLKRGYGEDLVDGVGAWIGQVRMGDGSRGNGV